jgi:hypothetical protein
MNRSMTAFDGSPFEDRCLRTPRRKLIPRRFDVGRHACASEHRCELYDTEADPSESSNLSDSAAHRDTIGELAAQLRAWSEEQVDRLAVELGDEAQAEVAP